VLLGNGIPVAGSLATPPVVVGNPAVSEGNGVTHLCYDVSRSGT